MNKETRDKLTGITLGIILGIGLVYGSIMLFKHIVVSIAKAFMI